MDPAIIATIVGWFTQPAAQALFTVAQTYVQQRLGLNSSPPSAPQVEPLLGQYLQKLTVRLDEDRIAKLYGAFSKLTDAPKSVAKQSLLNSALDGFHEVARIPQQGTTGNRPNAELRCMAFVGMIASYTLLQDRAELIEEKMIEAVSADAATAKQWLGEALVREILTRLPAPTILCPECGFQNPAGSNFCNRDGYPLNLGYKPSLPVSFHTATLILTRFPKFFGYGVALEINLDGETIGAIRNGESYIIEIQAGHHTILVADRGESSRSLSFDIAPGEKLALLCRCTLWKNFFHGFMEVRRIPTSESSLPI